MKNLSLIPLLVTFLLLSCDKNSVEIEQQKTTIIKQAEILAIAHNEGLDYVYKILKADSSLKSTSIVNINTRVADIVINYIDIKEDELQSEFGVCLKFSTTSTDENIRQIIQSYETYDEIEKLMDAKAQSYVLVAKSYLDNNEIDLDALLNKIAIDERFTYKEKLALCSFIKTLEYSKKYWETNNWNELSLKTSLKSASLERVVLADCYFLWWGTLSGGPLVGAGAGVVASAISAL
jgi:hypothetical protein